MRRLEKPQGKARIESLGLTFFIPQDLYSNLPLGNYLIGGEPCLLVQILVRTTERARNQKPVSVYRTY
jgi:hypothetical protein